MPTSKLKHLAAITSRYAHQDGALLPILNAIQAAFGCIDEEAERHVAASLNLTAAEVHGVVSFYHDFRSEKASLPVVKLCRAEACQARGSEKLASDIEEAVNGKCELQTVYCLGLCSVGPSAMVGDRVHARLDEPSLKQLIEAL